MAHAKLFTLFISLLVDYCLSQSGYTYTFYDQQRSFQAAENFCQVFSGTLPTPQRSEDETALETALNNDNSATGRSVWLGGQSVDDAAAGFGLQSTDLGTRLWRFVDTDTKLLGQGCYRDPNNDEFSGKRVSLATVTAETCIAECKADNKAYAVLKLGRECYCTNTFGTYGPIATNTGQNSGSCDKKCDDDPDGLYYCGSNDNDVYTVLDVDGGPSFWYRNTPNNDLGNQQCGLIVKKWPNDPYRMDDHDCFISHAFICQDVGSSACLGASGRSIAPSNGKQYCAFRSALGATWYEARDKCFDLKGDLVTFSSNEEFITISDEVADLPDSERSDTYWMGVAAHMWKWNNGEFITYTDWGNDKPSNINTGQQCIRLSEFRQWEDVDCMDENYFACQFDVDECSNDPCGTGATCVNTDGSYECQCQTGYTLNGNNCEDTNECQTSPCGANADCTNTVGSYTCSCSTGYVGDGQTCDLAVDECQDASLNTCSESATCIDQDVGYRCECNSGYSGDGNTCTDIDECKQSDTCASTATCANTDGGYTCTCNAGYTGDGSTCTDINECQDGSAGCDTNAECTNTDGSFTCTCNTGFAGDGQTCADLDECSVSSTNDCSANADCTNTLGSYTCTCRTGYTGDGKTCTGSTDPSTAPTTTKSTSPSQVTTSSVPQAATNSGTTSAPEVTTKQPAADATTGGSGGAIGPGSAGASTGDSSSSLGAAEIVLIIVCVILIVVIVALIVFVVYYKRKNSTKNKVTEEEIDNRYDARPEASAPYTGHLGDDYYSNYYSGSENGSTTGLVPQKNTRAGHYHDNHYTASSSSKSNNPHRITLDEKY